VVFSALHDQLASLDRHAQLMRCFSAVAELLVNMHMCTVGGVLASEKIAFYVGLTENFGPVSEHSDIVFDRVITNVGHAYQRQTGRFIAPLGGVFQFNVIVAAQARHKVTTATHLWCFNINNVM